MYVDSWITVWDKWISCTKKKKTQIWENLYHPTTDQQWRSGNHSVLISDFHWLFRLQFMLNTSQFTNYLWHFTCICFLSPCRLLALLAYIQLRGSAVSSQSPCLRATREGRRQ
jgi:hypothetical protein